MSKEILLTESVIIDVPFHDCDPMQVVWHGNYARYFEVARSALLRKMDYDYEDMSNSGYAWPVVDMRVKYIGSARYAQHIKVVANLVEFDPRLKIDYVITCVATGKKLTKASTTQLAVDMATMELQFAAPEVLIKKMSGE
jgi:acyl-CoA thioester hydrolase